ncbi:MAG: ACT domain-containing protein [Mariprofundaceae bacterium]
MAYYLLSISGHDRPGIVRDVAEALLDLNANIEDSSMTALRGRFAMMLIVRIEDDAPARMKAALAELEQRTGLHVQSQPMDAEEAAVEPADPDHVVTVHGADRVGIVHAVARALADAGVSIVDLSTRVHPEPDGDAYMMAMEVAAGDHADEMRRQLDRAAKAMDIEIEVHSLDGEVL